MDNKYVELYSIKERAVLETLKLGKTFKALKINRNKLNYYHNSEFDDINDTIAKFLRMHILDKVETPIYTYVITRDEGIKSHLRDRDFRGVIWNPKIK